MSTHARKRGSRITEVLRTLERECQDPPVKDYLNFDIEGETYRVCVANNLAARLRAYRFVYEVYSGQGYGQEHLSKLWFSFHDLLPDTFTVTVLQGEEIVAAVTVVPDSPLGLPADDIFGSDLRSHRERGHRVAEVLSLAVKPEMRSGRKILGRIFCIIHLISRRIMNASHFVITVVPHHAPFYERLLLFKRESAEAHHEKTGVTCRFFVLSLELFPRLERAQMRRTFYRYFEPCAQEEALVPRLEEMINPMTPEEIQHFLSARPELLESAVSEGYLARLLREATGQRRVEVSLPVAAGGN
jgi:N-acyl amino acid synthase FeeM